MAAIALWACLLLVSLFGLLVSTNSYRFGREVEREARALQALPGAPGARRGELAALPAPVRRYLEVSGAASRTRVVRAVRLTQSGTMTLEPGREPVRLRARQTVTSDPPGFVWWGRVRLGPGLWIDARDKVSGGSAGMRVVLESTKTLQDAAGPELDRGALVRLLGELTWLPQTFLDPRYVSWEAVDDVSARARLRVGAREVSATFHFGADGLPERFTADRYRDLGDGRSELTPFVGVCRDYRDVDGLRVPHELTASWLLDGKPYTFAHLRVDALEFEPSAS